MNNWKIKSLYYGKINVPRGVMAAGLDPELMIDIPYVGYLLQNGRKTSWWIRESIRIILLTAGPGAATLP